MTPNEQIVCAIMFLLIVVVTYLWVRGLDNMKEMYPDYKGEDFLDWENEEKK